MCSYILNCSFVLFLYTCRQTVNIYTQPLNVGKELYIYICSLLLINLVELHHWQYQRLVITPQVTRKIVHAM